MIKAGVKDMGKCVDVMEEVLTLLHEGDYVMGGQNRNSHGVQMDFPDEPKFPGMPGNGKDRRFMAMPAYLGGRYQMAGMKWYGSNVDNKNYGLPRSVLTMMLNDKDSGVPLAMMSANLVSAYRTGAVPGVGARYLARKDAKSVGIIGPGVMGKTTLKAFTYTCPGLDTLKVKGHGKRSMESFLQFVKQECPQIRQITVCETIEEAVRDSDIVSLTTSSPVKQKDFPFVKEEWIKKGALLCLPATADFDDEFLAERCRLVVDNYKLYEAWAEEYPYPSFEPVQIIGAKFTDMLHDGTISREDIIDIADIISGEHPGRQSEDEIFVYSVGGMPVEDIAWGTSVYRNALKQGIGVSLPLWDVPEMA